MEDFILKKGFLSLEEQKKLISEVITIDPGLYSPVLRNGNKMSIKMNCLGYHWSSITYKYDKIRDVDGKEAAAIPDYLQALAQKALIDTGYWPKEDLKPFDICIVNFYNESSKLGIHRDDSETQETLESGYPIVSFSVGASAIFNIGGVDRKDPMEAETVSNIL